MAVRSSLFYLDYLQGALGVTIKKANKTMFHSTFLVVGRWGRGIDGMGEKTTDRKKLRTNKQLGYIKKAGGNKMPFIYLALIVHIM